jgi:hypothetical protein
MAGLFVGGYPKLRFVLPKVGSVHPTSFLEQMVSACFESSTTADRLPVIQTDSKPNQHITMKTIQKTISLFLLLLSVAA